MVVFKKWDARKFPILSIIPGNGTGIQVIKGQNRAQAFIVWNNAEIEQFCYNENEAYFVLQEVLDGFRVGEDYEEPDEDDEEEDF